MRRTVTTLFLALACGGALLAAQASLDSARQLLAHGSLKEAEEMLRGIVSAEPRDADARIMLGMTLAIQGVRSEAIEQVVEAVRLRPDSAVAHNALGTVLSRFLETRPAREAFVKAIQLDPRLAEAHVNLSLILAQAGEFGPAGEHLDRAIELQGDTRAAATSYYLRARVWAAQTETEKALAALENAVRLRPDYVEAWSELGAIRQLLLDDAGALQALEHATALRPTDAEAQYRLGLQYRRMGQPHQAAEHLMEALNRGLENRATLYNLQLALREDGQLEEAKRIANRMEPSLRATTDSAAKSLATAALTNEGIEMEKKGNLAGALAKYRAALDMEPDRAGVRLNYALALCRLSRWQEGILELREVLRLDPNSADATKALYIALEQVEKSKPGAPKPPPAQPLPKETPIGLTPGPRW
jgi:tetratricopeptide (TPR) repeat protein